MASRDTQTRYSGALVAEIRNHRWPWTPETVYLGGGTPSQMPPELLSEIMAAIPAGALTEVTIECAPGSMNRERLENWRACGINRVSLGVQSFDTSELRQTGRRHTAETVASDVEMLRKAGIHDINIDLIAGLPNQTRESWIRSLEWLERLSAPHASVYIFEIDQDSRLGKEVLLGGTRYGAGLIPSDDLTAELYEMAIERLAGFGLKRYEISNFAQPGFESRHNLKYWNLEPYIGFGLDAHSFDGSYRWSNPDDLDAYLAGEASDRMRSDISEEHFFVGLRLTNGIEPTPAEWERFDAPIQKWLGEGMLHRDGNRLRLSDRGLLVSNEIFEEFIHV